MPRSSQYERIEFQHNSRTVVARVYIAPQGTGERDEIVSLNIEGLPFPNSGELMIYEEAVLIEASIRKQLGEIKS